MENTHISELRPELAAIESKQFRATVTLIWPYSSSARQFALLLAEPDLRLRRKNGQVRARFSGASAKAFATTGVGIGDEVVLSLRGAEFVKEGAVSTPGKSIEWELSYTQTVMLQVYRNGSEIANLELVDAAPTPAPGSPVHRIITAAPTPAREFSSPAFLKRARLSDGPFFQAPYDPFADETEVGHDKKRRRKSYRDWKAWTYSARTPSPEKEDVDMEEELESVEASPSRAGQLPRTPDSPQRPEMLSIAAGPLDMQEHDDTEPNTPTDEDASAVGESPAKPRTDADHHDLYTGPDEHPHSDAEFAFGGDTEIDTEVNTEEEGTTHGELNVDSTSTTEAEAETEERENEQLERVQEHVDEFQAIASAQTVTEKDAMTSAHDARPAEVVKVPWETVPVLAIGSNNHADNELTIAMPPPTLSAFPSTAAALLTPIGQEPASPTLAPQDASNLPLPSPFPGEHDTNTASYFGITTTIEGLAEADGTEEKEQDPPSEASYIGETSFFSSIGSSRASAFHPNHESAFTPVRFTFGMDGAGYSRPMELSSPAPEAQSAEEQAAENDILSSPTHLENPHASLEAEDEPSSRQSTPESEDADEDVEDLTNANPEVIVEEPGEPEVIELSSEDEEDDSSEIEMRPMTSEHLVQQSTTQQSEEDHVMMDDVQSVTGSLEEVGEQDLPTGTQHSTATSAIVDLGSPSDNDSEIDSRHEEEQRSPSRPSSPSQNQSPAMDLDSHSEFVNLDFATADAHAFDTSEERTVTHTQSQGPEPDAVSRQMEEPLSLAGYPPASIFEATDDYLQDAFPMEHASFDQERVQSAGFETDHPSDINVEIMEEASVSQSNEYDNQLAEEDKAQTYTGPAIQHSIFEDEDIQSPGSTEAVPEPPARNIRSKAKTSVSQKKEEGPVSPNTRTQGTVTSLACSTVSPPRTRIRSIFSPSQESTQTSPYSLRSQSRLSQMENLPTSATTALQKGPRKHASQRSVDSIPDLEMSQTQGYDRIISSFQPSQELGASQGRYSNVEFVKDSEEESVRSEHSISTVHPSDMEFMHHSDPVDRAVTIEDEDDLNRKPPPATAPQLRLPKQKIKGKKNAQEIVEIGSSSPARPESPYVTQSLVSSAGTQRRVARSQETTTPSPRNVRRTRRKEYDLPGEGSEDFVDIDELLRSSPPTSPRVDQRTRQRGKKPITPNATQHTAMDSQPSLNIHHEQDTLLTPQLTQTTSAGLRSIQTDAEFNMEAALASPQPESTPRRKQKSAGVATAPISPTLIDPSSDDANTDTPESPSVGLSTPLAYYTPLKDLLYFLNRSSQFHSAANPDVLALVTSATTPSEKAKKGPKHWFTTLQITDASSWPQTTTTVQIFRAYQIALPEAQVGDVILLRAFAVKSLNRHPMLVSADESAWCVWRWGKPVWGAKKGAFGELRAREETKGPAVEKGMGEWREVEKLRGWYMAKVQRELAEKRDAGVRTRSKDKGKEAADMDA